MATSPERTTARRDAGLGLVEVVVAVVLLGVLMSVVLAIVLQSQASTVNNRARVAASNLAARELDYVREQFSATDNGPLDLAAAGVVTNPHPLTGTPGPLVVDGTAYTVRRSVAWNITGSGSSACEGGALVKHPTMNVRVEVTWPGMGQTKPVVATANLAPSKGTGLSTTTSYVAVKVTRANGQPNPGRSVTVFANTGGETRTGVTDESGCAVVEVSPAAGSVGTSYSVKLTDSGHVDIAGDAAPQRVVGNVKRGELNSSIDMAYDRSASLTITVVGGGVTDADVAGSTVSLYQSQFTGASAISTRPITGVSTTITGLWPTEYGAFLSATTPPTFDVVAIPAGGTGHLDVPITLAKFSVVGHPAGATLIAAPTGSTSCTTAGAREINAAAGEVLPGTWSLFAQTPAIGCSPGPADQALGEGDNGAITWEPSTLMLQGAGAANGYGPLWAVSAAGASATCTVPTPATDAVLIGQPPNAQIDLPAGDWYVFATPDSGAGPVVGQPCISTGLVRVEYGTVTTFTWTTTTGGTP